MTRTQCTGPECTRDALPWRKLCSSHHQQLRRGRPFKKLNESLRTATVSPERMELYQRISEESKAGRPLAEQAKALGVSHGQLKHLRVKAFSHGFDISPVDPANRGGMRYETATRIREEDVPRCECGLAIDKTHPGITGLCDMPARRERVRSGHAGAER